MEPSSHVQRLTSASPLNSGHLVTHTLKQVLSTSLTPRASSAICWFPSARTGVAGCQISPCSLATPASEAVGTHDIKDALWCRCVLCQRRQLLLLPQRMGEASGPLLAPASQQPPKQSLISLVHFCAKIGSQRTISLGGYFSLLTLIPKHCLGAWAGAPIWEVGTLLYLVPSQLQWLRCCDWIKFWSLWLNDFPNAPLCSSSRRLRGSVLGCVFMASLHSEKLIRVSVDSKTYKKGELRTGIVGRGRYKWNQVRVGTGVVPSSKQESLNGGDSTFQRGRERKSLLIGEGFRNECEKTEACMTNFIELFGVPGLLFLSKI